MSDYTKISIIDDTKPKFNELNYKLGHFDGFSAGNGHVPMRGMSFGTESADPMEYKKWVPDIPDVFGKMKDKEKGIVAARAEYEQRMKIAEYVYDSFIKRGETFSTNPNNLERSAKISQMHLWKSEHGQYMTINYCASDESKRATEKRWKTQKLKGKPLYIKSSGMTVNVFLNGYLSGQLALKLDIKRDKYGNIKKFVHIDDYRFFISHFDNKK